MSKNPKKKELESVVVRSGRKSAVGKAPMEPKDMWAIAIFVAVTIVFFWSHLFGTAFLWEDFTEFTYPNQVYAARNFMAGIIPYWNPYTFNGMPFVADLQIGFFYPLNQLMYLLSGGELSARLAQVFVVLHYLIAMIGMWKLARVLRVGQWGSILAGITYGLCGMMVAQMIHSNMVQHFAWFPLIIALFYKGITERRITSALLSGITLGVALLSGHPQSLLFIVFFLFCLATYLLIADLRSQDPSRKSKFVIGVAAAAIPVVVGIGIFAIQLLPSQELAGLSERAEMTYEKSLEGSLSAKQLLTLVVPKVFGVATGDTPQNLEYWLRPERYFFWESVVYIGIVTMLLAGIGFATKRMGGLRWFLGGMALFGMLYALGNSFFIHPLLSKLPLFGQFRIPTRMAIYFALGGSILAGVGLERIINARAEDQSDNAIKALYIVGGLIVLIGLLTVTGTLPTMLGVPIAQAPKIAATGIITLLVGIASMAVAWAGLGKKLPGLGVAISLLLLAMVDLFNFGIEQNASPEDPSTVYKTTDAQSEQLKAQAPNKLFRVSMREGGAAMMQRNQGPYSGIMLYEGYNPLLLARRVPPAKDLQTSFDLLNIKYGIQIDSVQRSAGLAERPSALGHARMIYDVKVAKSQDEAKEMMKSGTIDVRTQAVVEFPPGTASSDIAITPSDAAPGTATISKYDAAEIITSVNTDRPGLLVLSEIWYPAWNVTIDDKPATLMIADYSLRGVVVPAGKHEVRMRFESSAFATGKWITIATALLSIAGVVVLGRKKVVPIGTT